MNYFPVFGRNVKSAIVGYAKRTYTTPSATTPPPPPTNPSVTPSFDSSVKRPLSKLNKLMCVWAKRYPSMKDVPDTVSPEVWTKVRSVVRIKTANYTMLLLIVGCVVMIVTGKRARDSGDSLVQRNLEWHKKYTEGKEEETKNIGVFGK